MKKNWKNLLINLFLIFFLVLAFKNKELIAFYAIEGINLYLLKVFPFLFIMIILENLLINYGILNYIKKPKIVIILLFLLGGSPTSAILLNDLVKNNSIDDKTANKMLKYSYFSNPLFCYYMLYNLFLNKNLVIKIILSHYLSNIFISLIHKDKIYYSKNKNTNNLGTNIISSIKKSVDTNLMILGPIVFFMILNGILNNGNSNINIFISGIIEITQGLNKLSLLQNNIIKIIYAIIFISFGGLSIHLQIYSCLDSNSNLKYSSFFKGRILCTLISIFIFIILTII